MKVNGVNLNVSVEGQGSPLILVHGVGANLSFWDDTTAALSGRWKIIRYDLRGSGLSETTDCPPVSLEILANDLNAIMEELSIAEASIVGWSLGGMIALQFALDHPRKIKSMVLVGSTAKLQPRSAEMFAKRLQIAETDGMQALIDETFHLTEQGFAPTIRQTHPDRIQRFKMMLLQNNRQGYAALARALIKADLTRNLSEILKPVLIIVGQYDVSTPMGDTEFLCLELRNSAMKILRDCGHYCPIEQPELFSDTVASYLAHNGI
jgi:3-oxoadipate enol-lactonase